MTAGSRQVWDYIFLARLHVRGGDLNAAKEVLTEATTLSPSLRDQSILKTEIGNVAAAQGDLPLARISYEAGLQIAEGLAQGDPSNTGFQRDLMVSNVKLTSLNGSNAAAHWREAYRVLKALDEAGKMQPVDRKRLEFLEQKVKELDAE